MTNNDIDKNAPRPRLCHLRRWPDFVGYGFNLHCEKLRPGQYIGKVDPDSPAESAGLRESDRIIEVNFVPIGTENHKQVVARIKEGVTRNGTKYPEEVILLVVDQKTDDYYKSKSYVVRSSDENVIKLEAEIRNGSENGSDSPRSSNRSVGRSDSHSAKEPSLSSKPNEFDRDYTNATGPTATHTTNTSSPAISRTSDHGYDASEEHGPFHRYSPPPVNNDRHQELPSTNAYANINTSSKPSPPMENSYPKAMSTSSSHSTSANGSSRGIINLDMSAAEYREKLKSQSRKHDPRQNQQMSMKQKRDFIDGL